jgi:hypothetical protein
VRPAGMAQPCPPPESEAARKGWFGVIVDESESCAIGVMGKHGAIRLRWHAAQSSVHT